MLDLVKYFINGDSLGHLAKEKELLKYKGIKKDFQHVQEVF